MHRASAWGFSGVALKAYLLSYPPKRQNREAPGNRPDRGRGSGDGRTGADVCTLGHGSPARRRGRPWATTARPSSWRLGPLGQRRPGGATRGRRVTARQGRERRPGGLARSRHRGPPPAGQPPRRRQLGHGSPAQRTGHPSGRRGQTLGRRHSGHQKAKRRDVPGAGHEARGQPKRPASRSRLSRSILASIAPSSSMHDIKPPGRAQPQPAARHLPGRPEQPPPRRFHRRRS